MSQLGHPESASEVDPIIGAVIGGKYKVIDAVARGGPGWHGAAWGGMGRHGAAWGGMGRIYRAEQRPIGRIFSKVEPK